MANFDWSKYEEKPKEQKFEWSKYEEKKPEEEFLAPKKESTASNLYKDVMIGLLKQRQSVVNTPHDIVHGLESMNNIRKLLSFKNYIGKNPPKPNLNHPISQYLPNEQNDISKLMGQEGTPSTESFLIQKGIEHAPELLGLASIARKVPLTAKGIMKQMSKHKKEAIQNAKTEYGGLFNEANQQGLTHVIPPKSALDNRAMITANSQSRHNRALNDYIQKPTLENAHWAQSELGSLERHMDAIADKNGLTPTQHKTLKAVKKARADIKKEMFSENALGSNPELGQKYQDLSNKYREEVVPYTRLEELTETEKKKMLPKNAVNKLLKDDQFMIELSRRYPGLFLHTPGAKSVGKGALKVGAGIAGYEGVKKLIK